MRPAVAFRNPVRHRGWHRMVHQEILLSTSTVWENFVLGQEPVNWSARSIEPARQQVQQKIEEFQFNLNRMRWSRNLHRRPAEG